MYDKDTKAYGPIINILRRSLQRQKQWTQHVEDSVFQPAS